MINIIRNAPKKLLNLLQTLWWTLTAEDEDKESRDYHDQILSFAPIFHNDIWYVEGTGDIDLLPTALGTLGLVDTVVMGDDITIVSIYLVPDLHPPTKKGIRNRLVKQGWSAVPAEEAMSLEKIRGMLPVSIHHATLK